MNIVPKKEITILGETIKLGETCEVFFNVAKLHTATSVDVPVTIVRAKKPGPTVLITAGIHGDEINGVEIIRQIIAKGINKPSRGSIICIPVINVFGFLSLRREFPDGRDLNRVFPGSKSGPLASRVANKLVKEILPDVDFVIDFHTGGSSRFNAPQVRIADGHPELAELANVFAAPFVLYSKLIKKSFRATCHKEGKTLILYEGGKSNHIDANVTNHGVNGVKRLLKHFKMLNSKFKISKSKKGSIHIDQSKWQRAPISGLFKPSVRVGQEVQKKDIIGNITDPYGKVNKFIRSKHSGFIINVNTAPVVYQGDAIFHITTKIKI